MRNNYNYTTIIIYTALIIFLAACKKDISDKGSLLNMSAKQSSKQYILGIDKLDGRMQLFKEPKGSPDWLSTGGDILVNKKDVEVIKTYNKLDKEDLKEIDSLKEKYKKDAFSNGRTTRQPPFIDTGYNIYRTAILWPGNRVKISISPEFNEEQVQRIRDAIHEWTGRTNIEVTQYPFYPQEPGVVEIVPADDPYSAEATRGNPYPNVGRMVIGAMVGKHVIIHEFGHVLGFTHEHQRPCRETFLHFRYDCFVYLGLTFHNIDDYLDGDILDVIYVHNDDFAFDYESIMIYASYGVSPSPRGSAELNPMRAVLIRQNDPMFIRQDNGGIIDVQYDLSPLDIERTNKVYQRVNTCPN